MLYKKPRNFVLIEEQDCYNCDLDVTHHYFIFYQKKKITEHFGYHCFIYLLSFEILQAGLVFRNVGVMITETKMWRSGKEVDVKKRYILTPLSISRSMERVS